jgi:hypothetical protein
VREVLIRIIRSVTQLAVLAAFELATPILDWVEAAGVDPDSAALQASAQMILFGLVVFGLTEAEKRWPILSRILSWNLADASGIYGYVPRHHA